MPNTTASSCPGLSYDVVAGLVQKQQDTEAEGLSLGRDRFRAQVQAAEAAGRATTLGAARKLYALALEPTEAGLKWLLEDAKSSRSGRRHMAVKWIELVGTDLAAYFTCKAIFDQLTRDIFVRPLAVAIADYIIDELRFQRMKERAPGLFAWKLRQMDTSNYRHLHRSLTWWMNHTIGDNKKLILDIDAEELNPTDREKLQLGMKLIDVFITQTKLAEEEHQHRNVYRGARRSGVRTDVILKLDPKLAEIVHAENACIELRSPVHLPMLLPPLPWGPGRRGGYRFALREKYAIVRSIPSARRATFEKTAMPVVYTAINALQGTAWQINSRVLEVLDALERKGGAVAGVPQLREIPLPNRPADIDTNDDAKRVWKRSAATVRRQNRELRAIRAAYLKTAYVARKFAGDTFYFPYMCDFRGRLYPITTYLSPQGDDLCRGLLAFSEGKPLGEQGVQALAIHGANTLGEWQKQKVSRMTLAEREKLVEELAPMIHRIAEEPLTNLEWTEAEEPFQFLAFCFEWSEACTVGLEYVSHLPVNADGSCNGLQHFAALWRDEIGGQPVNLTPNERPEDIYANIADSATKQLEWLAPTDELAALWLSSSLVTRKLTKRPTMTFGYGSGRFGFKTQLLDYLQEQDNWKEIEAHFTIEREGKRVSMVGPACSVLARLIWEVLETIIVGAFAGREWMQAGARAVARQNKPCEWAVPLTDFYVIQDAPEYFKQTKAKIIATIAGKVTRPVLYVPTRDVDPLKQANGIAPNFIHSLDAAALMLTVQQAADEGITSFCMIHDSYGTHAADVGLLARCTRQAFVRLHSQNIVGGLHQVFINLVAGAEDVKEPPPVGSLDLGCVLGSDYFFA